MSACLQNLPIESIRHRPDARQRSDEALAALVDSLASVGQLQPIRVRPVGNDEYEVVIGSHRLQAAELNGWTEIAALVTDDDDLHAELAMIDENLVRAELSAAERAQQTARRKAIYLELHPETAQHVAGAHASNRAQGNASENFAPAFTAATAKVTGQSERLVQLNAERGEKVSNQALDLVKGTRLDRGNYLDRLKKLPPSEQIEQARRDIASPPRSGISARYVSSQPQKPSPDASFTAFTAAADTIEGLDVRTLIEGAGRRRSVLGQRASGLADRMAEILEGLG